MSGHASLPAVPPLGRWAINAACRDASPHLFDVPAVGCDPVVELGRQNAAAEVCASCPVRGDCLADALRNGSVGVWGGVMFSGAAGRLPRDLLAQHDDPDARRRAASLRRTRHRQNRNAA